MLNERTTLNKAFKYSIIAILLFISNIIWVSISLGILKLESKIGGIISGLFLVAFFAFGRKGLINSYQSFKNKEVIPIGKKVVLLINAILVIVPVIALIINIIYMICFV